MPASSEETRGLFVSVDCDFRELALGSAATPNYVGAPHYIEAGHGAASPHHIRTPYQVRAGEHGGAPYHVRAPDYIATPHHVCATHQRHLPVTGVDLRGG